MRCLTPIKYTYHCLHFNARLPKLCNGANLLLVSVNLASLSSGDLIVDNHAKVKQWLEKHPWFHVHFTPTSAAWLNQVEGFFAEISRKAIRRGTFTSVAELEATINHYLARHNEAPKPFKWTAIAKDILKKLDQARTTVSPIKAGTI